MGLLRKTAGTVTVLGENPWRNAVGLHRRLAYVPDEVNLWPNLSTCSTSRAPAWIR